MGLLGEARGLGAAAVVAGVLVRAEALREMEVDAGPPVVRLGAGVLVRAEALREMELGAGVLVRAEGLREMEVEDLRGMVAEVMALHKVLVAEEVLQTLPAAATRDRRDSCKKTELTQPQTNVGGDSIPMSSPIAITGRA